MISSAINDETIDATMEFVRRSGPPTSCRYDRLIRCLGFVHDRFALHRFFRKIATFSLQNCSHPNPIYAHLSRTIYAGDAEPIMHRGQFPAMTHRYESVNVPGLFFAGALAHGRDYRRGAGRSIVGFRHTARALVRMLAATGLVCNRTSAVAQLGGVGF